MNKLPEKTSALIRVAAADLIKCENDERFRIDMGLWHSHAQPDDLLDETRCHVCLGGAVLSQTVAVPFEWDTDCVWHALEKDKYLSSRINALDFVRGCDIVVAVERVEGYTNEGDDVSRAVKLRAIENKLRKAYVSYTHDPEGFKFWLELVAVELEQAGY